MFVFFFTEYERAKHIEVKTSVGENERNKTKEKLESKTINRLLLEIIFASIILMSSFVSLSSNSSTASGILTANRVPGVVGIASNRMTKEKEASSTICHHDDTKIICNENECWYVLSSKLKCVSGKFTNIILSSRSEGAFFYLFACDFAIFCVYLLIAVYVSCYLLISCVCL